MKIENVIFFKILYINTMTRKNNYTFNNTFSLFPLMFIFLSFSLFFIFFFLFCSCFLVEQVKVYAMNYSAKVREPHLLIPWRDVLSIISTLLFSSLARVLRDETNWGVEVFCNTNTGGICVMLYACENNGLCNISNSSEIIHSLCGN